MRVTELIASKTKKWRYQLGLRVESSNYDGTLIGKDSSFKITYPVSFFPKHIHNL